MKLVNALVTNDFSIINIIVAIILSSDQTSQLSPTIRTRKRRSYYNAINGTITIVTLPNNLLLNRNASSINNMLFPQPVTVTWSTSIKPYTIYSNALY